MDVLNLTSEIAKHYAIHELCREDLSVALARVVADGKAALDADDKVPEHTKNELADCHGCIADCPKSVGVINGDAWESIVHQDGPSKSIDIGLLVGRGSDVSVFPIEGKLGIVCEHQGDRGGMSIRMSSLVAKADGFRALLSNRIQLCSDLLILVPRNGQEWAWYMIRNWNLSRTRAMRFFSCCLSDFLSLIGAAVSCRPRECLTEMNAFRKARLISEFEQPGPMSQVQLPGVGICTGCRKCRAACPKKAIAVISDDNGNPFPFVDNLSCKSGCRYCESVCPVLQKATPRVVPTINT